MTALDKYNQTFVAVLQVTEEQLPDLSYQSTKSWDSVGHMGLMAALEEAFEIAIDTDDIIDFSSYQKGKQILGKYNVQL
jgi:acyl carrier protein